MAAGSTFDSRTCQVCGERFALLADKAVHVSTAHDLGRGRNATDRTRRFTACQGCGEHVFVGAVCPCGRRNDPPAWTLQGARP